MLLVCRRAEPDRVLRHGHRWQACRPVRVRRRGTAPAGQRRRHLSCSNLSALLLLFPPPPVRTAASPWSSVLTSPRRPPRTSASSARARPAWASPASRCTTKAASSTASSPGQPNQPSAHVSSPSPRYLNISATLHRRRAHSPPPTVVPARDIPCRRWSSPTAQLHVPGRRLHQLQRHRRRVHLRQQVPGRELHPQGAPGAAIPPPAITLWVSL